MFFYMNTATLSRLSSLSGFGGGFTPPKQPMPPVTR